jgi:hypothetical protein
MRSTDGGSALRSRAVADARPDPLFRFSLFSSYTLGVLDQSFLLGFYGGALCVGLNILKRSYTW